MRYVRTTCCFFRSNQVPQACFVYPSLERKSPVAVAALQVICMSSQQAAWCNSSDLCLGVNVENNSTQQQLNNNSS